MLLEEELEDECIGSYIDSFGNVQDGCHPENNVDPSFSQILGLLLPPLLGFFAFSLAIKLLVSALSIKLSHIVSWRSLLWMPLVSLLGTPFLYFTWLFHDDHDFDFPVLQIVSLLLIAVAALLESTAYYFINKKKVPFKKVFLFSFLLNLSTILLIFYLQPFIN